MPPWPLPWEATSVSVITRLGPPGPPNLGPPDSGALEPPDLEKEKRKTDFEAFGPLELRTLGPPDLGSLGTPELGSLGTPDLRPSGPLNMLDLFFLLCLLLLSTSINVMFEMEN